MSDLPDSGRYSVVLRSSGDGNEVALVLDTLTNTFRDDITFSGDDAELVAQGYVRMANAADAFEIAELEKMLAAS